MPPPPGFVTVPAGPFIYGPEETYERLAQAPPPQPRQTLELDTFHLAARPVTYAEWKTFLDDTGFRWRGEWWAIDRRGARGCRLSGGGTRLVRDYPAEMANYPIVAVSQTEALAYCEWLGRRNRRKRAVCRAKKQWEKAARGRGRPHVPLGRNQTAARNPVAEEIPGERLRRIYYSLVVPPRREWARAGWYWRVGAPVPVGGCPENVGALWLPRHGRQHLGMDDQPVQPRTESKDFHVVKGGSWGYSIHHTQLYVRSACSVTTPSRDYRAQGTGFRVVAV